MANIAYQGMASLKIDAKQVKTASKGSDRDTTLVALAMPPHTRVTPRMIIIDAVKLPEPKKGEAPSPFAEFLSLPRYFGKPGEAINGCASVTKLEKKDGMLVLHAPAYLFTSKGLDRGTVSKMDLLAAKPVRERKAKAKDAAATVEAPVSTDETASS